MSAFWITNRVANPVLRRLLRTPAGRVLGRHLAVVRYRGRRTGAPHELVVQYARAGDRVVIVPGAPERKTWWRNLRAPARVDLVLAGRAARGDAVAVDVRDDPDDLALYARTFPRIRAGSVLVRVDVVPDGT